MVHGTNSIMFTFQPQQLCPSCYSATPLKCSPTNPYKTNKSTQVQAHDLHMHTYTHMHIHTIVTQHDTHTTQQPPLPPPQPHPPKQLQQHTKKYSNITNNWTKEGRKKHSWSYHFSFVFLNRAIAEAVKPFKPRVPPTNLHQNDLCLSGDLLI